MPNVAANGIRIEYETHGDPSDRPLLMIMGLGSQLVGWEASFCDQLAAAGHWVVRFDNRDVGLSTLFESFGPVNAMDVMARLRDGEKVELPYSLDDMADDTAALMDALELERAHVLGASMGGMIAQTVAVRHPQRVRSLISVYSSTGNPEVPPASPEAMETLLEPAVDEREAHIEAGLRSWKVICSPGYPFDEERIRDRVTRSFDRRHHPAGSSRQLAAILAAGNRKEALRSITAPTLVIHGDGDCLVRVEGGRDTADAIPGAELRIFEGMGHDLPRELWPDLVGAISAHTEKSHEA